MMLKVLREKFPDLAPRRILDLGCGPGTETLAFARAWPEAEMHGLDLSGPFVTFAHLWAEENGVAAHFRQGDAAHTSYPDGHFDLIVSHILFHETSPEILPAVMREARRLLAPGGVFFNADVAYQFNRISVPKQVTNAWQVAHNGEPFWRGFAQTDVTEALRAAGFAADEVFADYVPLGSGHNLMFGARPSA
jgi:SAM-dependent methyltransferase